MKNEALESWCSEQCIAGGEKALAFRAWEAAMSAVCERLEYEADTGCPDRQDEALTRENIEILREYFDLQPNA